MSRFIIKVEPGEDCNEEYMPDAQEQAGMEVDGYMLITFRKNEDGDMMGQDAAVTCVTVNDIREALRQDERSCRVIRAACALAEADIRAIEIMGKVISPVDVLMDMIKRTETEG